MTTTPTHQRESAMTTSNPAAGHGGTPTTSATKSSVSDAWARHRVGKKETRKGTGIALLAWIFAVYDFILFGTLLPVIKDDFGWSDSAAIGISTAISIGTA